MDAYCHERDRKSEIHRTPPCPTLNANHNHASGSLGGTKKPTLHKARIITSSIACLRAALICIIL